MRLTRSMNRYHTERNYEAEKSSLAQGFREDMQNINSFAEEIIQSDLSSGEKAARLSALRENITQLQDEYAAAYEEINAAQMEENGYSSSEMPYGLEEGYTYEDASLMAQGRDYGVEPGYADQNEQTTASEYGVENEETYHEDSVEIRGRSNDYDYGN